MNESRENIWRGRGLGKNSEGHRSKLSSVSDWRSGRLDQEEWQEIREDLPAAKDSFNSFSSRINCLRHSRLGDKRSSPMSLRHVRKFCLTELRSAFFLSFGYKESHASHLQLKTTQPFSAALWPHQGVVGTMLPGRASGTVCGKCTGLDLEFTSSRSKKVAIYLPCL